MYTGGADTKRELERRIPRSHSPVNYDYTTIQLYNYTTILPEVSGDFPRCLQEESRLPVKVLVENRFLPFGPVDLLRKPEPVPRTQVLS